MFIYTTFVAEKELTESQIKALKEEKKKVYKDLWKECYMYNIRQNLIKQRELLLK